VAEVIPPQIGALHRGSTLSSLDESTDSPAFSIAEPRRMSPIWSESTSATGC
jgi:hypothetical protein